MTLINKIYKFPLAIVVIAFLGLFIYLQQKISIYIAAYTLSHNYRVYTELSGQRDYLERNYSKETSLPRINQWAQKNSFNPVEKGRMLALNTRKAEPVQVENKSNGLIVLVSKVFRFPGGLANAQN
jgi:hypothetical protein